jgi:endonuclease III
VGKLARGRLEAVVRQCGSLIEERMAALEAGATVFRRQPRLVERLRGPLRQAWLAARDLPHLGHAGALGVLLFAGSGRLAPVDEGLTRFATRFGLAPPLANRRRLVRDVRRQLTTRLPADAAARRKAVLYLQHHADHTCVAGVPHCNACPLADACAEGRSRRAERSSIGSM